MEENKDQSVTFKQLFSILCKYWILILCCTIVGGILGFAYGSLTAEKVTPTVSDNKVSPSYASSVVYVINYSAESSDSSATAASSELKYSIDIVPTCIVVISQNKFYNALSEALGGEVSSSNLQSYITYSADTTTPKFDVTIVTNDADLSFKIAETITTIVPQYLYDNFSLSDSTLAVACINEPEKATSPISSSSVAPSSIPTPSNKKYLYSVVFALLSFVVVYVVLLLIQLFDTRIKDEESITKMFNIPILGVVPNYEVSEEENNVKKQN